MSEALAALENRRSVTSSRRVMSRSEVRQEVSERSMRDRPRRRCTGSCIALLTCLLTLRAWGQPPVVQGNPLVPDTIADPSIVCFDGTYYLYATTDIDRGLSAAGPPVVWKSKDFLNWSFDGILIPGVQWGKIRYWAPGKVVQRHGVYYLY